MVTESEILAVCPVPIVSVKNDLGLLYANGAAASLFDLDMDSLDQANLLNLLPGLRQLDRASFGSPDGTWLLHGAARDRLQVEAQSSRGTFQVEVDVMALQQEGQDVTVVVLHDMTALNGSLANILRAHRELEEFNRVAIGRELRMVALKEEINDLLAELGRTPRYIDDD